MAIEFLPDCAGCDSFLELTLSFTATSVSTSQQSSSRQPGTATNQPNTAINQPGSTTQPAASTTASQSKPIYIWPCLCSTNAYAGLTQDEIIEQLVNDMKIDVHKTAKAVSKKACRDDSRLSVRSIGTFAIVLLVACGGILITLDLAKWQFFSRCACCH